MLRRDNKVRYLHMKQAGTITIAFSEEVRLRKRDVVIFSNKTEMVVKKVRRMNWWRKILCLFSNRFYVENMAILSEVKK